MNYKNTYCVVKLQEEDKCLECGSLGKQYIFLYANSENVVSTYKPSLCHKCVKNEILNFSSFDSIPFRLFLKIVK